MITNTLGQAILDGTTVKTTFAGLPIIGCLDDYTDSMLYQPLLDFAASLGAPCIITDVTHDGAPATPALIAALQTYSRFFVPGQAAPFLNPDRTVAALCGPIITLSSLAARSTPEKSLAMAQATRCFRRNHKLGYGVCGVYPVVGEDLDIVQRPPIYLDRFTVFGSESAQLGQYYGGAGSDYTTYADMPYWQILGAVWKGGNWTLSSLQNIWRELPTTAKAALTLGLGALQAQGDELLTRQFLPSILPLLLLYDYAGGGGYQLYFGRTAGPSAGLWPANQSIGISNDIWSTVVQAVVPCNGEIYNLVVQGHGNISGATTITIRRAPGGLDFTGHINNASDTALVATLSGASGSNTTDVVQVNRGDLLTARVDADWQCDGATVGFQFRPKLKTILGQII